MCNVKRTQLYAELSGLLDGAKRVKRDDVLPNLQELTDFGGSPEVLLRVLAKAGARKPTLASIRKSGTFTALSHQHPVVSLNISRVQNNMTVHSLTGPHGGGARKLGREADLMRTCGDDSHTL